MIIRLGKKLFVIGKSHKERIQKERHRALRDAMRLAETTKAPSTSPIDMAQEFATILGSVRDGTGALFLSPSMSARERIITVTSYLDEMLRFIITLKMASSRGSFPSKSAMDSVFKGTNVLGSFGDRIALCSAFGLIPTEIKGELGIMKELRNEYSAHTFDIITFDTPAIATRCLNLQRKMNLAARTFQNEFEQRFMDSAWAMVITLIFVAILLVEQHKTEQAHLDAVIASAKKTWRELTKSLNWGDVEPPASPQQQSV